MDIKYMILDLSSYSYINRIPCDNLQTSISILESNEVSGRAKRIVYKSTKLTPNNKEYVLNYCAYMRIIRSNHVVKLLHSKEVDNRVYIYLPYYENGDLEGYLSNNNLSLYIKLKMFMQILLGLKDIHQHYIVHRDLKLKNIFVDSGLNCIIGDLGISSQSVNSTNSILGTYGYQAPEVYSFDSEGYNDKIDMWAIGIIAFQMFNRKVNGHLRYPFGTLEYLYDKLKDTSPAEFISKYRYITSRSFLVDADLPQALKYLMFLTIRADPKYRPSWVQLYQLLIYLQINRLYCIQLKTDYSAIDDYRKNIVAQREKFISLYYNRYSKMKILLYSGRVPGKLHKYCCQFLHLLVQKMKGIYYGLAGMKILSLTHSIDYINRGCLKYVDSILKQYPALISTMMSPQQQQETYLKLEKSICNEFLYLRENVR